jgi:hypothetical protein
VNDAGHTCKKDEFLCSGIGEQWQGAYLFENIESYGGYN